VKELQLRPATASEWDEYRAVIIPDYAAGRVRAGEWDPDEADALSAKAVNELLPEGVETRGMLLRAAETPDGDVVGLVWLALNRPASQDSAWIYYIEIFPRWRGKGYGRALLRAAEQESMRYGATNIGLNVFGENTVARSLYDSSAYAITSMTMRKELSERSGEQVDW
jgi:ribosomal protein S18 acetylase RimI-like enzyme